MTPQKCIVREIKEEMWLEVTSIQDYPSFFVTVFYKTTLKDLNITPSDECQEVGFFTTTEAMKLELFPNVIEFCKQYKI
jgi:8-oxo-dGTP pyrophosphatase MutT (NUDIX family)